MDDKAIDQLEVILKTGAVPSLGYFANQMRAETEMLIIKYAMPLAQQGTPWTQEQIDALRQSTEDHIKRGGYEQ
jgi:hypothetical protein